MYLKVNMNKARANVKAIVGAAKVKVRPQYTQHKALNMYVCMYSIVAKPEKRDLESV